MLRSFATSRRLATLLLLGGLACDARALPPAAASAPRSQAPPAPAPQPAPAPAAPAPAPASDLAYLEFIHVPPGTPASAVPGPGDSLPMLVLIHGLGDRPEDFKHLIDDLPATARVIVPRGLDPVDSDGWSWFPIRARSNDIPGLSQGIAAAADRLAGLLTELQRTRPTTRRVVTGFSQGGMLSFALAVYHPRLLDLAVPVGGWLPPPLWPSTVPPSPPKIVALHGEVDVAVKFEPTRDAVAHLEKLGWPVVLKPYPEVGHAIPPVVRRELYLQLQRGLERSP
jgi:phospholipase/carboxylesterase